MNASELKRSLEESSRYSHWGGYAAAVAALDGFDDARQSDPVLAGLLSKLDTLDQCSQDDVMKTMQACGFHARELDQLSSPLLDGLWKAATGRDPRAQGGPEQPLPTLVPGAHVLRLVFPRVYIQTLRWFVIKRRDTPCSFTELFAPALILGSTRGLVDVVELLLPLASPSDQAPAFMTALEQAVVHGRLEIAEMIFAAMSDAAKAIAFDFPLVRLAAEHGHTAMIKLALDLFNADQRLLDFQNTNDALDLAISGCHEASAQFLYDRLEGLARDGVLQRSFRRAVAAGRPGIVQVVARAAQAAGVAVSAPLGTLPRALLTSDNVAAIQPMLPFLQPEPFQLDEVLLLWRICESGHANVIVLLLDAGLLHRENLSSPALLEFAVQNRSDSVLNYLIANARIDTAWSDDAVVIAAASGKEVAVMSLLQWLATYQPVRADALRAVMDAQGLQGLLASSHLEIVDTKAALLGAAVAGQVEAVRTLLERPGLSLYLDECDRVVRAGHAEVVRLFIPLMEHEWTVELFRSAVALTDPAVLELLVDAHMTCPAEGLDAIHRVVDHIWSAVHDGIAMDHPDHVAALLPLLSWYCTSGRQKMDSHRLIETLVQLSDRREPSLDLAALCVETELCMYGRSAVLLLDGSLLAAISSGNFAMAQLYLDAGANVRFDCNRPLCLAEQLGHAAIVDLLKARGAGHS